MTGIIANQTSKVSQGVGDISEKGAGKFGLTLSQLEQTGAIKSNLGLSTDPADLDDILSDPSVFTGKKDIASKLDLLNNENLQGEIYQESVASTLADLEATGAISGLETPSEIAGVVGLAGEYDADAITDWANGTGSAELSALMDKGAKSSQYAVDLIDKKGTDLIGKIQAGATGAAVTIPVLAKDTVDLGSVTAGAEEILGNNKIAKVPVPDKTDDEDIF